MYHKSDGDLGKVTGSQLDPDSPEVGLALMLDQMGERYGMLPSQVLAQATTQDVYVYDMYCSYSEYIRQKHKAKSGEPVEPSPVDSKFIEGYEKFKQKTGMQ